MNRRFSILGILLCVLLCVDIGVHVASLTVFRAASKTLNPTQENQAQPFVVVRNSDTKVIDLTDYPQWQVNENGQTYGPNIYDERPDLIASVADNGENGYVRQEDMYRTGEIPIYASDGTTVVGTKQIGNS